MRPSCRQRGCGPKWPTVEQLQSRWGKSAAMVRRTWGQYSNPSPSPTHLSHTTNITLSRIKCERLCFYKEVCSFVHLWYFDLRPGQKCHSKVMHRKEVTQSNGSYERKSHGRKLADEMGRGKKFPWHTHRLMHWKRVTCELHDIYFCLMTIQQVIPKIE